MSALPKHFRDEAAAFAHLERMLWPKGKPICPHCGTVDNAGRLNGVRGKPSRLKPNGPVRLGLWKCYACRKQFTVKVGTVFEGSHIPLHQCLRALDLLLSRPGGVTTYHLVHRLDVDFKSAQFLLERIRGAIQNGCTPARER